ncbi:MAG: hypothetical protein AAGA97_00420 [Pseudomonadota bacterium]
MKVAAFFEGLAMVFRFIGSLIRYWPIALLALLFLSPETPHLRWTYQYVWQGDQKRFVRCTYLGIRGQVTPDFAPHCPVIALLNPGQWR